MDIFVKYGPMLRNYGTGFTIGQIYNDVKSGKFSIEEIFDACMSSTSWASNRDKIWFRALAEDIVDHYFKFLED